MAYAVQDVPWKVKDALVVFIFPWVIIPFVAILALQLIAGHDAGVKSFLDGLSNGDPGPSFALVILDAVASFGIIGFYLNKYKANWSSLGFKSFSLLKMILYILLLLAAFSLLVAGAYFIIQLVSPSFNPDQAQTNEFTNQHSALSLWALVVIPPLVEEPVFRGFMFPAFAKRFGVPLGAVIASVLFGFAHLQANVSVYTFILSLLLCWMYRRLGSIIPGIGLHMLNNYIAYSTLK